ncbi:MAG: NADH-quinone oxidoreductase subunit NuoF [Bdellovibrionota bacterium]
MSTIISHHFGNPQAIDIGWYQSQGGYKALEGALKKDPSHLIETVKASGLRGRGGAGFPTGLKWSFVPQNTGKPIYMCVNADEGEPGTFKDREILTWDPHLLIEGMIISCFALRSNVSYIYIRGEYRYEASRFEQALKQAKEKGFVGKNILGSGFDLDIHVHMGAGAYICGEETSLLNSLEGKRGYPRLKPPFPAVEGLFQCPTIVNNVETLANIPFIVSQGPEAFRKFGTEKAPGTRLFAISGHVSKPGVYERNIDINLLSLIEEAGGMLGGKKLKAVIPGGASSAVLKADECNIAMDFDSLAAAGSMGGSGAVIVMDETTCMVRALRILTDFFAHESCGQCTPCREGSAWIAKVIRRVEAGQGTSAELDMLFDITDNMKGKTVCVFSDATAAPVESFITKFRSEFEAKVKTSSVAVEGGRVLGSQKILPTVV